MSDIPDVLSLQCPVFTTVALDYAGPLTLKTKARVTRRNPDDDPLHTIHDKIWIMLITCMVSGAISLEVVVDLTIESFLRAFSNHCNVRGSPASIYSDNFATFKKAAGMLKEVYEALLKSLREGDQAVKSHAEDLGINWRFTVPYSSHWNGRAERQIGSVRTKLAKSIGKHRLNFAELHSLLKRVEAIINNRPLMIAQSAAMEGRFILTPSHFMLGRETHQLPEISCPSKNVTVQEALKTKEMILKDFWERFRPAHIETLKFRQKWTETKDELKVNDLVLLVDADSPPAHWQKGLVVEPLIGRDGHVRAARVKVSKLETKGFGCKIFERPISKLVVLRESVDLDDRSVVDEYECEGESEPTFKSVVSESAIPGPVVLERTESGPIVDKSSTSYLPKNLTEDLLTKSSSKGDKIGKLKGPSISCETQPPRRSPRLMSKKLLVASMILICCAWNNKVAGEIVTHVDENIGREPKGGRSH